MGKTKSAKRQLCLDESKPEYKNFHFVSDNAVVILTEADENVAWETLSTVVRFPNDFHLEETE